MTLNNKSILITTFFLFFLISCNGGEMAEKTTQLPGLEDVPASAWEKLAQKKIYFGHQSVGYNIMDGIKDIVKEKRQINLNIVETTNKADFKIGLFAHSSVGENRNIQSKIDDFSLMIGKIGGDNIDIAFFKFCYVDMTGEADVQNALANYSKKMAWLKEKFPKTTFIHVTVPLTSKPTGTDAIIKKTKNIIKRILGRPVYNYYDNIKRNQFNELLRNEYGGKELIFDLAKIESIDSNGNRSSFTKNDKIYYTLVQEYTNDGGHLNEKGRKNVAEQLLIFLANLS